MAKSSKRAENAGSTRIYSADSSQGSSEMLPGTDLSSTIAKYGNKTAVSDVGVGALLVLIGLDIKVC